MDEEAGSKSGWTDADSEILFANIGKYLIIFQWMESEVDQILLLAWGFDNWAAGQAKLAKMTNCAKVEAMNPAVCESPNLARAQTRPDWWARFEAVIGRLHTERTRRNDIVHSQYLFDFVKAGFAPIRSKRIKVDGKTTLDQDELSKEFQEKLLEEISELAMDLSFIRVSSSTIMAPKCRRNRPQHEPLG